MSRWTESSDTDNARSVCRRARMYASQHRHRAYIADCPTSLGRVHVVSLPVEKLLVKFPAPSEAMSVLVILTLVPSRPRRIMFTIAVFRHTLILRF